MQKCNERGQGREGRLTPQLHFETTERRRGCGSCWQKPDKPIKVVAAEGSQLAMSWQVISAITNNYFLILPSLRADSAQDVTRTLTLCSKPERAKYVAKS